MTQTRTEKQREDLVKLLKALFQLDQPDLDFGFYRIMHAKADTVGDFLKNDLIGIIEDAFGEADQAAIAEARQKYEKAIEEAKKYSAPDPEATEPVQKAKAALDDANNRDTNEGEIYEHLYRFFERYYDDGDFMSRRYFARETDSKAATYAVPYDGREVYLHWANRDQYYIKTSEYLSNFTFDIAQHFTSKEERVLHNVPDRLKLHCRIVEATEGEHNNNKANDKTERFFLIHEQQPVVMESGELVLQFEYRPDSEKSGTAGKWQEGLIDDAESTILTALEGISEAKDYHASLSMEIGKDKDDKRSLLRKYLNQYTKRNTTDYFIHKDLGGFLKRELDFYIKNEMMQLDDIMSAEAPFVESYLDKIKVLRRIAEHLITFLTQLEEFQKKLWLKKKFVTETQYCITLDRIPEAFYAEIAANEKQREEWEKLFAINELDGYKEKKPLIEAFLKANPFLVLDTAFFPATFKDALVASLEGLDENLNGLLIHSENFQALGLMQEKYREQVKCVYIDPPYNSPSSEIIYKNNYKHSSWLSLMLSRIEYSTPIIHEEDGGLIVAIDENEQEKLSIMLEQIYPKSNYEKNLISIRHNTKGIQGGFISINNEYAITISPKGLKSYERKIDKEDWEYNNFRNWGGESERFTAKNCFYPIFVKNMKIVGFGDVCDEDFHPSRTVEMEDGTLAIYPIDNKGIERKWTYARNTVESIQHLLKVKEFGIGEIDIQKCRDKQRYKTIWDESKYIAGDYGSRILNNIMGSKKFDFPKSIHTVEDCLSLLMHSKSFVLDYFAGSATTGHAVINLNRADNGNRKYIMVEMGDYFDSVTKPRMQKVVYSTDWKDGKPISREGSSHAFKYIRLESYEDALNNLHFKNDPDREKALEKHAELRHDYMLKYWLEFETKDSPSLLNIKEFDDPTNYILELKKPGSDEYQQTSVDLTETFNWLIGLHVDHLDQWRGYSGKFKREPDPELPDDNATRLILNGRLEETDKGNWLFRKVEGRICRTPGAMDNMERVLVIWRKLTGNLEEDNLMLDEWFKKQRVSPRDSEFDVIYVNGSNNLPNIRQENEHWKVQLIEEIFHQKMWDVKA